MLTAKIIKCLMIIMRDTSILHPCSVVISVQRCFVVLLNVLEVVYIKYMIVSGSINRLTAICSQILAPPQ